LTHLDLYPLDLPLDLPLILLPSTSTTHLPLPGAIIIFVANEEYTSAAGGSEAAGEELDCTGFQAGGLGFQAAIE